MTNEQLMHAAHEAGYEANYEGTLLRDVMLATGA